MMSKSKGFSLIVVLVVVMMIVGGVVWHEIDKKRQVELRRAEYAKQLGEIQALAQKWDDANQLASSTPRVALAGPVGSLQSVKRETQALNVTGCLVAPHEALVTSMNKTIEAYLDFMGDKEYLAEGKLKEVIENQQRFRDQITECSKANT